MSASDSLSAEAILRHSQVASAFSHLDHATRMMASHWITQAVYVAAELNLAQLLLDTPRSTAELAAATSTLPEALGRVTRALVSLGLLRRDGETLDVTDLSRPLADPAGPQRLAAIRAGKNTAHAWGELLPSVRTGTSSFEQKYGMPIFEYLAANPMMGAMFDEAMTGIHGDDMDELAEAYDFGRFRVLLDVGGGNGSMLIAALTRHPTLRGILLDLPDVVERAEETLASSPVADRCQLVAGDFLRDELPAADGMLLRHVLHNWPDDRAEQLLASCRRSLVGDGRVVIAEMVLPTDDRPHFGKLLDLAMLAIPGGRERTEAELESLLRAAGLRLQRVTPTGSDISAVEAAPA